MLIGAVTASENCLFALRTVTATWLERALVAAGKLPQLRLLSIEDMLLPGLDAFSGRSIRAKLLTSLSLPRTFAGDALIRCGSFRPGSQRRYRPGCCLLFLQKRFI